MNELVLGDSPSLRPAARAARGRGSSAIESPPSGALKSEAKDLGEDLGRFSGMGGGRQGDGEFWRLSGNGNCVLEIEFVSSVLF